MSLPSLFRDHLELRLAYLEQALAATGFESLVISSGAPFTYYADDHEAPFQGVPHFRHYCPLEGPNHLLRLEPGRRPMLVRYRPADYWYEQTPMDGASYWADLFDFKEAATEAGVWALAGPSTWGAYLGDMPAPAAAAGFRPNPEPLVKRLDWGRSSKTAYEIRTLEEATELGAKGHLASRAAFLAGGSEVEIHHAFVQAVDCLDHQLAFPSIVALDPKGAILHYHNKRHVRNGKVLLLDCGAQVRGYGSDITRTTAAPACDPRFTGLMDGVKRLQRTVCQAMRPGLPFLQMHELAHAELAALLGQAGILKAGPEEAMALGLTRPFLPHGLGHFLGINIHDVAGKLTAPDGVILEPPAHYPALRVTRILEPGQVLTVEPGLYFIPMLLEPFRNGAQADRFNWELIDQLAPLGGIRFEDNVVITEGGARNITQEYLPSWEG
ncbi:MAG: Xaa-Pro dipeptidase [Holophaga sp.]|nr:Xaa-Pro dipeptidase [Holophaga sp.]